MPTTTSSRHPLSSRPNSPRDLQESSYFTNIGASSSSSSASEGFLTPSHGINGSIRPSRSPSPSVLAPRRRRKGDDDPAALIPASSNDDDYDPKKRSSSLPFHTAASARRANSHSNAPPPPTTTLDRLESLFGISNDPPPPPPLTTQRAASSSSSPAPAAGPPGTRLVLQHSVQATDTLQALALRYKTDVATLRKVNGLWPSDSVLSRNILWVPLDRCKELGASHAATVGVQDSDGQVVESTPSALGLVGGSTPGISTPPSSSSALPAHLSHDRTLSSTASTSAASSSRLSRAPSMSAASASRDAASTSPSDAAAAAAGPGMSPPIVRRLPSEVLGHFPAAKRSETHLLSSKGKSRADQWNEELVEARPKHRLGPGPGMSGYDPGQSGVEDLLQLAREARRRGSLDDGKDGASSRDGIAPGPEAAVGRQQGDLADDDDDIGEVKSPPPPAKDDWKPNVWRFGEKRSKAGSTSETGVVEGNDARRHQTNGSRDSHASAGSGASTTPSSSLRPLKLVEQSIQEWQASSSSTTGTNDSTPTTTGPPRSPSSYQGWNDVPTLDAYAKGKVVEAYGSSSAAAGRKKKTQRAFLDDLAAGLPANSGQASKWARPIGGSFPTRGAPSTAGSSTAAAASAQNSSSSSSWRNLFSDTLRGRMPLDQALSIGLEGLMDMKEWSHLPPEEMDHARRLQQQGARGAAGITTPTGSYPSRPPLSAAAPPTPTPMPPPSAPRRKSQHEMHVIDQQQHQQQQRSSSTTTNRWGWQ